MLAALRQAVALELPGDLVLDCASSSPASGAKTPELTLAEGAFVLAFEQGLAAVPGERRGGLQAVAGNVAEGVLEVLLAELGWTPLAHDGAPASGGHGVDLLMLSPVDSVVAVEVKSTMQPGRWPRLGRGAVEQLGTGWLDSGVNPAMSDHDLTSDDVHALVAFVHFGRRRWKAATSTDLVEYQPVRSQEDLMTFGEPT